ncbi:hypothetical protein [Nocardia canadensis]|uniref:hypothetical protein n=1 Tax=Nocardia canadensis TaxID=3065238 RepID=UPI00292F36E5|nr:hypothetical protein [Nocardia canadensis]
MVTSLAVTAVVVVTSAVVATAEPVLPGIGIRSGVSSCPANLVLGFPAAEGGPQRRDFTDSFATPRPDLWCSADVGTVPGLEYGPQGARFGLPRSDVASMLSEGAFLHDNNEILSTNAADIGDSVRVTVTTDFTNLRGSAGWGYWNRAFDPAAFSVAWFMYQTGPGYSEVMARLRGVIQSLGTDTPDGFFVLVRRPGSGLPIAVQLDDSLLGSEHTYQIDLHPDRVDALVDGEVVASVPGAASSVAVPPLITNLWLDNQYWSPIPFSQFNPEGASSMRMSCLSQARIREHPSEC